MYSNPFVDQLLAKERMEDAIRRSERAHLIRFAQGSKKSWRWRWSMTLARQNFLLSLYRRNANNLEGIR